MARVTYRTRLQSLIDNPHIAARDLTFCESLLGFYNRSGKLSAGRANWVKKLEERYAPERLAGLSAKVAPMVARLESVHLLAEPSSWAAGFVESLLDQARLGRDLSTRQIELLEKIESEHSDEAMTERAAFIADYENNKDNMKVNAGIVSIYYRASNAHYFACVVEKILADPSYTPSFSEYNKIVKNKYAQKVLASHYAPARYSIGTFVKLRAGTLQRLRRQTGGKPCIVIQANAGPVTTAAKGTKVYSVLPVGRAETILVEERDIMRDRTINPKPKKKGSENA